MPVFHGQPKTSSSAVRDLSREMSGTSVLEMMAIFPFSLFVRDDRELGDVGRTPGSAWDADERRRRHRHMVDALEREDIPHVEAPGIPIPLAQSIELPPPTATMPMDSSDRYTSMPDITCLERGLTEMESKMVNDTPASVRLSPTASAQPAAGRPGAWSRSTCFIPKLRAYRACNCSAPYPQINSGAANFLRSAGFSES